MLVGSGENHPKSKLSLSPLVHLLEPGWPRPKGAGSTPRKGSTMDMAFGLFGLLSLLENILTPLILILGIYAIYTHIQKNKLEIQRLRKLAEEDRKSSL